MNLLRVDLLVAGLGFLVAFGCTSAAIPESSRTGQSIEIKIGEGLTPKVSHAKTGDEVRWVNTTNSPVHIALKKNVNEPLSCLKGFVSNEGFEFVGSPNPKNILGATVHSNDFASLCFSDSGIYDYTVKGTELEGTVMVK